MALNELEELQQGGAVAQVNEYDALIEDTRQVQKQAVQQSMYVGSRKDPARQAEVMALAEKVKMPASFVERNFDDVKQKQVDTSFDYGAMIEQTPGLAKWMENADNAALGRDDLDPLGRVDKNSQAIRSRSDISTLPDELRRSAMTGYRGVESSTWHLAAAYGLATPEQAAEQVAAANKRSNELRALMPDYAREFNEAVGKESGDVNKAFAQFTGSYKEAQDGNVMKALRDFGVGGAMTVGETLDMISAAVSRPRGLMYSTVENLANSAPALALGAAGAKGGAAVGALTGPAAVVAVPVLAGTGMAVGSFAGAVPMEVGSWINQEMQSRGVDVTDPQAITAAYRDTKLMADIRAEAERKGITTAGVDALFNAFAGRLFKAKPGASVVRRAAEGAVEVGVQATGEATSEFAGQVAAKKGLEGTNFGDAIQEGIVSLGHSAADVVVGQSTRAAFSKDTITAAKEVKVATDQSMQAVQGAQVLGEIGRAVGELKNTNKVPGKIQELIDGGGAPQAVYFQADDWDKYWTSKGKSPVRAAEQILGDGGKRYNEAKQTGVPLEIPLGAYVEHTTKSKDFEGLLTSARLAPDAYSVMQAREHMAALPATMKSLADEVRGVMEETQTKEQSAAAVGQTVAQQLKEVGVDEQAAALYEEGFRVLGERMGVDPKELFDQFKLRITGETSTAEGQTFNQEGKSEAQALLDTVTSAEQAEALTGEERDAYLKALETVYGSKNDRAQKMGFGRRIWYHGTSEEITQFNKEKLGASTGANSAKQGFFFAEDPSTASDYADLAREKGVIREEMSERLMQNYGKGYHEVDVARGKWWSAKDRAGGGPKKALEKAIRDWEKHRSPEGAKFWASAMKREGFDSIDSFIDSKIEKISSRYTPEQLKKATAKEVKAAKLEYFKEWERFAEGDPSLANKIAPIYLERADKEETKAIKDALKAAEELHASTGQNVLAVRLKGNPYVKNYKGQGYRDSTYANEMEAARASGKDSVLFKNTEDPADPNNRVTQDIAAVFEPNQIRAVNAAFDPRFADSPLLLAQQDDSGLRGQIKIGKGGIDIAILKNANASTFFHETGHFYLEVLKDLSARENAPAQIKQDYETIRDWLGAEQGKDLTVDQHEQFARGFEAYLLDGKAPTSKLAEAFSRFKVWLLSVYRKMRPNVEFSKDVREVMNRLFATDEELSIASGDYPPLFDTPTAMGMNEKQAAKYAEARMAAKLAAEEDLTKKLIDDYRQQEKAFYKDKRVSVREEVEGDIKTNRDYAALGILQRSEMPDGSAPPRDLVQLKISKDSLKALGAKNMPPNISTDDQGMHVELVAPLLGYRNGQHLVDSLSGLPPVNQAIEVETDKRMAEYYPDSLVDGTLGEETIKSLHNDKRAELLRMELEHLASLDPATMKDITRRIVRRPPSNWQVREEAVRIVGSTKTLDIKPHLYQRAEVKAAKDAGIALAKGDIDGAFEAKQRELLNHELYRESLKARDQIDAAFKDFRKYRQSDEKLSKNRDTNLIDTARAILAAFGIGVEIPDQYAAQEILSKMQRYDQDNYETAKAMYDNATENGVGPWQQLSFDDFSAIQQSVDALWDLARSTKQIEVEGQKMELEQVKEELIAQSSKFIDTSKRKKYTETAGVWAKAKAKLMSAKADMIRVEHWAEAMDVDGNREFTKYVFRPIADAATKYRLEKNKVIVDYKNIIQEHEAQMSQDPIESDEIGHRFKTKTELLMAVLHSGNGSNLRKLLVGRGWGTVDETGRLDSSKWDTFIARMQMEGVLTKADYDFVQKIWDLMESLKPGAQKAHKAMYGYYFKEITTDGVETPFGTYRGGYIPAKLDVNESEDADIRTEREQFEKNNNSWQFPTTGRGFTKSRVEQYAGPLTLDMNMLGGHIDAVMRFTHIEPRVKEVSRIVTDKAFREVLRQVDPAVAKDALIPWLQRSAQQQVVMPSRDGLGRLTDAMASQLRSGVAMQLMFGNITNTLQQLTGVFVAGAKIKPKYLRNAVVQYLGDMKNVPKDIVERSEWMRSTQGTNTYETAQAINNIIVQPSTFENMQQFAKKHTYFMQTATQNFVNSVVWMAGYNQALESGMTEDQAVKAADSAVRTTQGTVNPEDVSRFETGTQTERLFKQFVGYFNMLANLNGFELQKIARTTGLKKGAGKAFYVYMMGVMIPAVASEMIVRAMSGKGFDEDDDDQYLDDALSAFFGSQFKTITATVPYGGALAVSVYNRFNEQRYDDRLSLSPVISVLESAAGVPYELYRNIHDDVDNEKKLTKDALQLIGVLSSLPSGPIGKPVGYLMDVRDGKAQPSGPFDFTRGLITGKSGIKR